MSDIEQLAKEIRELIDYSCRDGEVAEYIHNWQAARTSAGAVPEEWEPDLFWNADCPEDDGERSELDLADRCGQDLQSGQSMVIDVMCAMELPARQMEIWVDADDEMQWEWVETNPPSERED